MYSRQIALLSQNQSAVPRLNGESNVKIIIFVSILCLSSTGLERQQIIDKLIDTYEEKERVHGHLYPKECFQVSGPYALCHFHEDGKQQKQFRQHKNAPDPP